MYLKIKIRALILAKWHSLENFVFLKTIFMKFCGDTWANADNQVDSENPKKYP